MPRRRTFRRSNPWWTKELTKRKKTVYRLRWGFQAERDKSARRHRKLEYRSSLREYRRTVKQTKLDRWRKFVTSNGNSEPWRFVYKLQAQKLRVRGVLSTLQRNRDEHTIDTREIASLLLNAHVPDNRECEDTPVQREIREGALFAPDNEDTVQFTEREVAVVIKSLKNGKAPGPDLIEVRAIKAAGKVLLGQQVRLFNGCLRWGISPLPGREDRSECS